MAAGPTAVELRQAIRQAGLDPAACYRVRDLIYSKDDVRLYLNEGYLIFSRPVLGQRLAAVFTSEVEGGDAEVILIPPNRAERQSLAGFIETPNLDEHLRSALLVFTDGSANEIQERLAREDGGRLAPEMGPVLATQWGLVVANVLDPLGMRIISDLAVDNPAEHGLVLMAIDSRQRGTFDILADARDGHRITVRQRTTGNGQPTTNVWTSFFPRSLRNRKTASVEPEFRLSHYDIRAEISSDFAMQVTTRARFRIGPKPLRTFPFLIANSMQMNSVKIDGKSAELVRDGPGRSDSFSNGMEEEFLVMADEVLPPGSEHEFEFQHAGRTISTRGSDVYFVNARNSWYPHADNNFVLFDLSFRYPKRLTLVAPGEAVEDSVDGEMRVTRRRTQAPIFTAGFNLGVYEKVTGTAGGVNYEVYGNRHIEDALRPRPGLPIAPPVQRAMGARSQQLPTPTAPDPLGRLRSVASDLASSLEFFRGMFGPPVLNTLTVAPIPGTFGQGFPGLVYLSTFAYIDALERPTALRRAREQVFYSDLLVPHEAAHQWWGGVVTTSGPENEWLLEALANYSSLMWLEKKKGRKEVAGILNAYRDDLITKNDTGNSRESAGPITWGSRLESGPEGAGWSAILYGKGTWILHMLRRRLGDEAFTKTLAELRKRYEFNFITTEGLKELAKEMRPKNVSAEAIESFFDNWVYSTGIPQLKLQQSAKGVGASVKLTGSLIQSNVDEDFAADVPIEVQYAKGSETIWVRSTDGSKTFSANLKQVPVRVAISDDILMK